MEKILLVGSQTIDKLKIAEKFIELNSNMNIASMFSSDPQYINFTKENNDSYIYYNSNENINLDYKNNALFYIMSNDTLSYGVTLDEFYNNDIVILDITNFNSISDKVLNNNNILIVWIDCKYNSNNKFEMKETKFLMDRINKYPYLYFFDTDNIENICKITLSYITAENDEVKKLILSENS